MYELHASDYFSDSSFPIIIAPRDPQPIFPLHTHDFSELVLVLGGTGIHFTEHEEYQVVAGDVFLINGRFGHGYRNNSSLILTNIIFRPEGLGIPSEDLNQVPGFHALFTIEPSYRSRDRFESRLRLESRDLARAASLVEQMELELNEARPGYRFMTRNLFHYLVGFLSRCYSEQQNSTSRQRYRLGKVISFMERHCDRPLSIAELTEITGESESTLLRDFHFVTGLSPLAYHMKIRIERSCRLLRTTDLPVTRIALDAGFSDPNYFSRQFRKVMGASPSEYRRRESME
jgi:AraC-like DNA-binding protein